jgi:hypothetical protein
VEGLKDYNEAGNVAFGDFQPAEEAATFIRWLLNV